MKICIIGGSTAGWWTAGYLEKNFPEANITLYGSDKIPPIGVGESTLPQMKWWWEKLGIKEKDWFENNATLKYGNYKEGWNDPDNEKPFVTRFWYNENNKFEDMMKDESFFKNGKLNHTKFYEEFDKPDSRADYAYHVCAESTASMVKKICKKTKFINETLEELPEGYDLYVDCTGFHRKFVKDHTKMEIDHRHFVDRAWVCPMKKTNKDADVTKSIARKYGWSFEINLQNRVGMGYVFSSRHVTELDAKQEYLDILKKENREPLTGFQLRLIKWEPLVLKNPWAENVVAIGTSSGFVDPLEAFSLFMTQSSITQLVDTLKRGYKKETYNRQMRNIWKNGMNLQIMHYTLSKRKDTQFWRDSTADSEKYKKMLWDNYRKYSSSFRWLVPSGIWCQLGIYFNEIKYYAEG